MVPTALTSRLAALALATLAGLPACAFRDLPEDSDFAHYEKVYRDRAAPKFAELDRKRAAGTISATDYGIQRQQLETAVTAEAHEAILRYERLRNELIE